MDEKNYLDFERECRLNFKFLEEKYGFKVISVMKDPTEASITFANATTAIDVRFEPRDNFLFVYLIRLKNGKMPDNLLTQSTKKRFNRFDLDLLIEIRTPSKKINQRQFKYPFSKRDFREILSQYAEFIKTQAKDILQGDFTVFSLLESKLKKWLREY